MFKRHLFLPALLLCAMNVVVLGSDCDCPDVIPANIKPPEGFRPKHVADAAGEQIYVAVNEGGKLIWKLQAPRADLKFAGEQWKHYAGPTWEAADGSKIKKTAAADAVSSAPAPNAADDIPWLLIKVEGVGETKGELSGIQWVQRIATKGGKAPAQPPTEAGQKVEVKYQAIYIFYGKAV